MPCVKTGLIYIYICFFRGQKPFKPDESNGLGSLNESILEDAEMRFKKKCVFVV